MDQIYSSLLQFQEPLILRSADTQVLYTKCSSRVGHPHPEIWTQGYRRSAVPIMLLLESKTKIENNFSMIKDYRC